MPEDTANCSDFITITENGRTVKCTPQQLSLAEIVSERVVRKMLDIHMNMGCLQGVKIQSLERVVAKQGGKLRIILLLLVSNLAGAGVVAVLHQLLGS